MTLAGVTATLARLPLARLTRARRGWLPPLVWSALALGFAALVRGRAHAADHALLGVFSTLALPLLVFGIVAAALGGESVRGAVRGLTAFGAAPARASVTTLVVAMAASALLGAALGAGVAAIARGAGDPPLARDIAVSAATGALGGASYAAYFGFGSTFGARGGGRIALLVVDFVLGGAGVFALVTPRGHVRNLLGGDAPLGLAGRTSLAALAVLAALYLALAALRSRRP